MQIVDIDYALFEVVSRQEAYRQEAQHARLVRELLPAIKKQRIIRRRIGLSLIRFGIHLAQLES